MIEVSSALTLIFAGAGLALVCVVSGCVIHMRWIDRKLMKPLPKPQGNTQQLPAVKVSKP